MIKEGADLPMEISVECISCLIDKGARQLQGYHDMRKRACMRDILKMMSELEPGVSAPLAVYRMEAIIRRYYPKHDAYAERKRYDNKRMMALKPRLEQRIQSSPKPLAEAIRYAIIGNYIDFGALNEVKDEQIDAMLESNISLPEDELSCLASELRHAKKIAYLHDNCGEIALDILLIDEIHRQFPCEVMSIVRGEPVLNDATGADARMCGIDRYMGNGTAIAGTELSLICDEARSWIDQSDLIISKGQGNFETLYGHGMNVYYLFLCKCEYFTRRFGLKQFEGVFANERRMKTLRCGE